MDAYLMGKVSELETRIQNLEKEIEGLKHICYPCVCTCHKFYNHKKFYKHGENNNAIICCDC